MQEIAKKAGNKKVRLMFQDEGRFGLMDKPSGCWSPPGFRPDSSSRLIREYIYGYCAVSPHDGEMVSLVLPYANHESMSVFLRETSERYPDDYIAMLMDRAGWHIANDLEIPENMCLMFLPPYSPELNPIEHVWDDLREKHLKNRFFKNLNALEDRLCFGLKTMEDNQKYMKSLTGFSWIIKALV